MKKILTILAASAMFFAFGEDISNGMNFETYTSTGENSFPGEATAVDPGTGNQYWYSASYVGNVISNHPGMVAPVLPSGVTVPDMFVKDTSNTNFLYLETESPLFRTVKTNGHVPAEFEGVSITENPIYLDTLVKFTAADSEFTSFEDTADKIAIEYVEHEEESHEDPEGHTNIVDSVGFTNFVIRAGYVVAADNSATIVETNYYAAVPEGFNKDAWHRLTVRSIANIDGTGTGKGHVGFVVYLDQVPLKYATSVAVGNATFESNLNADVTKNFYNSETPIHALYPSAVDPEELTGQKISAVAFSGNGSVDDVVFTTTKPGFINESSIVTVTWDAHVATLTLNGNAVEGFVAGTAGNANVEPENGVVLVAATFAAGWEAGTFTTDGDGSWDSATSSFVALASGETCNIVSMQPLYSVSAGGTTTKYDNLEAALEAAAAGTEQTPATLKLLADCNTALGFSAGYIILDLNGCDIQGNGSDFSIGNAGATLIITNSGAEASILIPADNGAGEVGTGSLYAAAGFTTIQAGTFDGPIYSPALMDTDDSWSNYMLITGGKFIPLAAYDPEDPTSFYLYSCVAPGLALSQVGDYVQVGASTPPPIGTYTVTVTPNANATYAAAYNDGGAEIVPANDVLTVTVGKTITITATPAGGYEYASVPTGWTAGQDGKITIEVSAEAAVAIPAPTAVVIGTYSVTVTPTANATYAAAYNDGGAAVEFVNDVAAVTVGKTITITATPKSGYEYAEQPTGWTLSEGVITIEVSAEATVAIPAPTAKSSYPSYITGHDDYKDEYDTWAQTYGADTASAYEAAFLLNIAPNAEDQTLKPTAITMEGGKVVITANQTLTSVNGKVYVKVATTLAGLSTAEWAEATLSEGKVQVTPGSSDTAGFYKIKVDF